MSYVKRTAMAWSNQWLREMSWRELEEIHRAVLKHGIPVDRLIASRLKRAEAEWARRKKEGGGGMAAARQQTKSDGIPQGGRAVNVLASNGVSANTLASRKVDRGHASPVSGVNQ